MFAPGQLRAISKEPLSPSVKLRDVMDCDEWRQAVDASELAECYYCVVSWEDIVADPGSRVLSYRWADKIRPECAVTDPAGVVTQLHGDVNLQFLRTPARGWKLLWVDFLGHLNDIEGLTSCLSTMGKLYLTLTVLPQYFLLGDYDLAKQAMDRGWMHQELSYGTLDVEGVKGFLDIATRKWVEEGGCDYRGNPFCMESVKLFSMFKFKRIKSAAIMKADKRNHSSCIMEIWAVTNGIETRRAQSRNLSNDECLDVINAFCQNSAQKQLSEDAGENLALLQSDVLSAWCVIAGACNTNIWDKSDMYYATTKVVGEACGLPVDDPLKEYKLKTSPWPTNDDGTLKFTVADLDLDVLNRNNEVLRTCWKTLLSSEDVTKHLPNDFRNIGDQKFNQANYRLLPPGMHTVGLGPIRSELVEKTNVREPLALGPSVALTFYDVVFTNKPLEDSFAISFRTSNPGIPMPEEEICTPFAPEHFCEQYLQSSTAGVVP